MERLGAPVSADCSCVEPVVDSTATHLAQKLKLEPEPPHRNASAAVMQSGIDPPDDISGHLAPYTGVVSIQ